MAAGLSARFARRKVLWFLAADAMLLALSMGLAAWLRFDGRVPAEISRQLPLVVALGLLIKLPTFAYHGLYRLSWSQVSLDAVLAVFRAVTVGTIVFWTTVFLLKRTPLLAGFPRGVLLIDYIITLYAVGAFRMSRRIYQHVRPKIRPVGRMALIVGAGAAGEQLVRTLRDTPGSAYRAVGFIDDNPLKTGTVIHGLRVLGGRELLLDIARERGIEAILIAMPSAPSRVIRNVVSLARQAGVRDVKIVPGLDRILNGHLIFSDLREIQVTDLLGREMVQVDTAGVEHWLRGKTVLVTGAGGSIGSELCRQMVPFGPRLVVLLDYDETGLFLTEQEMQHLGQQSAALLADVRDEFRTDQILSQFHPHVVFHAAAYKHVGLMERHPEDAVRTNVLGTRSVAAASLNVGAEKFIFISTDKAVNPTSVMGASKRVAEQLCLVFNERGKTKFIAVRFGNVLGSRGSVIPLFMDNIRKGEAITIRGPNMRRYFMAIAEAVLLVLQAGAMGQGGETYVLDMGEPVRIADLARELIRLAGLEPEKDVPIIMSDPEPGEKEHEDLLTAEEGTTTTRHDRVFAARSAAPAPDAFLLHLARLEEAAAMGDTHALIRALQDIVPMYHPSSLLEHSRSTR